MLRTSRDSSAALCVYNCIQKMRLSKLNSSLALHLTSGVEGSDANIEFDSLSQLSIDSDRLAEMNKDIVKGSPCTFTPQQVNGIVHKNRFWREPIVDTIRAAIGV